MLQAIKWAHLNLSPNSTINSVPTPPLIAVMLGKFIKQYLKLHLLTYKMAIIVPASALWLILLRLFSENSYVNSFSKMQIHAKSMIRKC